MTSEHRIAKLLARAGVASRREIERMIAEGRIALNGTTIETPATLLTTIDGITVDGEPVAAPEPTRLFLYNKPTGLLVTEHDPMGRPTIYDRLPEGLPRLMPVGRLDLNTEGLLLLTTDGGFKRQLELPATGVERTYRARAYGDITQAQLEELIHGIEIDGIRYGQIDANLERRTGANVWIELTLREGKNREVRRVLEHLGLQVSRLIRLRYGPFVLDELPVGEIGEVKGAQIVEFRKTLLGGIPADAVRPTPRAGFRTPPTTVKPARPARPDDEARAPRDAKLRSTGPAAGRARPGAARSNDRPERASRDELSFRSARPTDGDRPQRGERPFRARSEAGPSGRADRDDRPARGERPFRTRSDGAAPNRGGRDDRPARAEGSFRPRSDAGSSRRADRDERPARGDRPFRARSDGAASGREARAERPAGGERSFRPRTDSASSGRGSRDDRPARTDRSTRGDRPTGDRPSRGPRNSPGGDGRPSGGGRDGRPGGGGSRPGRPGGHR